MCGRNTRVKSVLPGKTRNYSEAPRVYHFNWLQFEMGRNIVRRRKVNFKFLGKPGRRNLVPCCAGVIV